MPNRSGNTKRKKRNEKKQLSLSVAGTTDEASAGKEKKICETSEVKLPRVEDAKDLRTRDECESTGNITVLEGTKTLGELSTEDTVKEEQNSLMKTKKKKKKKKIKESDHDGDKPDINPVEVTQTDEHCCETSSPVCEEVAGQEDETDAYVTFEPPFPVDSTSGKKPDRGKETCSASSDLQKCSDANDEANVTQEDDTDACVASGPPIPVELTSEKTNGRDEETCSASSDLQWSEANEEANEAQGSTSNDDIPADEPQDAGEKRNFDIITHLLYGVGTSCLRRYFLRIHPYWNNQPTDASALKKGVFQLQNHENKRFYTGNVDDWDVSLLVRVLRFTAVSSVHLQRNATEERALRKIHDIRNNVVAHAREVKISGSDFDVYWNELKTSFLVLGEAEDDIDSIVTDDSYLSAEYYRSLLYEELSHRKLLEQRDEKANKCENANLKKLPDEPTPPAWDSWIKFCGQVNSFQSSQIHYVLLSDSMTQSDLDNFKVLSAIPWKMVLDFNPSSEDDGLYKAFHSQSSLQKIVSPFTPGEIKKVGFASLPKQIDSKRTQWLFVNGRKEDTEDSKPKSFPEWERQSVKHISTFFSCCSQSEKFDNLKSITCLLLPVSKGSGPFAEVTLKRFKENFSEFDVNLVCIDNSYEQMSDFKEIQKFPLSPEQLKNGIKGIVNVSDHVEKYKMPTFHDGIFASFETREYVYMNECLELYYDGCENEVIDLCGEPEEVEKEREEHRKLFLSGNLISFASLFFNHDAKREIEKDIEIYIQRLLNPAVVKHSVTVRIAHPPGTGGSTIARRVLWNLHKSFPCASVKLPGQSEFDEDSNFINELCTRISDLQDKCGIPPIILLDGHRHWRIHGLSTRIVRTLNSIGKRAVLLECQRGSKPTNTPPGHLNRNINKVFYVDARLEDSPSDLQEFKSKFELSNNSARRVFHFPLLCMIEEFRERLKGIVSTTMNELDDLEKDIASFVAFLHVYAGQSTPALLLYEAFKSRLQISEGNQVTYDSIKNCFSETLLNLMVQKGRKREGEEYTLQHHVVARLVFDKYLKDKKQSLFKFVSDFLDFNVPSIDTFRPLYCDLFVLNNKEANQKFSFSLLIEKLKGLNPSEAASIFRKAADRVSDPLLYGHAARFYAKMRPPKFTEANQLILDGLELSNSKGKAKSMQDSKGVVLLLELRHKIKEGEVNSIQILEELADKAIQAFRLARDFPPSHSYPLIGEVLVWLSCFQWILNNCCLSDKEELIKFLTTQAPPYFRTCIGDCFTLLDIVDDIVMSSTSLSDPDDTRNQSQRARTDLLTTIRPKRNVYKGHRREIDDLSLGLLSNKNLPQASQKEIKRFKASSLLSLYRRDQQSFKRDDFIYLVKLLEEMVLIHKDFYFARHFLQLCSRISDRGSYSLEQGWKVCCEWLREPVCYDPMRYYYSMVIAFMQILNGHGLTGYFAQYKSMIEKLNNEARYHCHRNLSNHFLGKSGDGMSQLIDYNSLLSGETSYRTDSPEVVHNFWTIESRRKLRECTGRLRVKVQGNKEITTIELLEGDIELHVGKHADIGKPGRDFNKDAKVYFVVSFNLVGPVANGITFRPVASSS